MKNSQLAGSQDDRAGTGWVRRWWTGDKLSVRLSEVAFVLVLTGVGVWAGWFSSLSPSQAATWSAVMTSIAVVGASAFGRRRPRMSRSR
jgi:cytochrome b subunit of formate dehydrogenase